MANIVRTGLAKSLEGVLRILTRVEGGCSKFCLVRNIENTSYQLVLIHTGENPHQCVLMCDGVVATLKTHNIHTGQITYQCIPRVYCRVLEATLKNTP